jgi:methionine-rich copper-binding protein CopC
MNNISLSIITTSLMLIFSMNTLYSQSDHRVIDNISVEDSDTLITEPDDLEVPLEPSVEDSDTLIVGPDDSEVLLEPLKPRTKYSVGLNVSLPQISDFWTIVHSGPYVGIVVSRPYVFDLGSFSVGVGAGVEILNMGVKNADYTGFHLSLESAIYETPAGPISVSGAGRWYNSIKDVLNTLEPSAAAGSVAIMFDYAVPGQPMVIQPYVREILFFDIENGSPSSYLISIGATIHYDISTLF